MLQDPSIEFKISVVLKNCPDTSIHISDDFEEAERIRVSNETDDAIIVFRLTVHSVVFVGQLDAAYRHDLGRIYCYGRCPCITCRACAFDGYDRSRREIGDFSVVSNVFLCENALGILLLEANFQKTDATHISFCEDSRVSGDVHDDILLGWLLKFNEEAYV